MKDFITALGLMMILEGMPYFLAPDRMRRWIMKIAELSERSLRQTGLILMLLGLGVVYLMRS
ncbi:MAG: DUF2065 domain-containing protein [Magnetococcales bacterium]|nr:DUF2065 domain-containing protein [Magnetococcales bacterium]